MTKDASTEADRALLAEFLLRLGQAYLAAGEQTARVELILRRSATSYGVHRARVVAFPTALFLSLHAAGGEQVTLAEGPAQPLRLDQISDVYSLGQQAQQGRIAPREGIRQLAAILQKPARFGALGVIGGHAILSVGLAMVLRPVLANVLAAALLGAVVGALKAVNRDRPVLSVPMSVVAAALVSALVFLALEQGLTLDPLHVLVPPLIAFLPGAMLTRGMVELAYGDMVSGSSRLITGFVQLVLLAFGLAAGAIVVGYQPENLIDATVDPKELPWEQVAAWLGALVFGTGAYFHFSAPQRSYAWMLLVLLAAFAAQELAAGVFGEPISGFFGMLVATPLGYLIQLRFRGPPAMVTFLPSFWLLVPGALGLVSVKQMLSDRSVGMDGLMMALAAIVSIALGTLIGASIYKFLTESFGWWQLQMGRAFQGSKNKRRRNRSGK